MSKSKNGLTAHNPTTISLEAFGASEEATEEKEQSSIRIMSIGKDAAYLGLFTKDGFRAKVHWIKEAPGWEPGFVHCLGDDCPACKAGLQTSNYILLPVLDRITAEVSLLRVSSVRGPGKLVTELGKVLGLPELENAIIKISRENRYNYKVDVVGEAEHDPDAIRAVQKFKEQVAAGLSDPLSSITTMSAEEMADHPHIEKILRLQGPN